MKRRKGCPRNEARRVKGIRITLAVHQFVPDFVAGTEVLTYTVAKELQRRGHEVEVWTAFPDVRALVPDDRFDQYAYQGIPVFRYHFSREIVSREQNLVEAEYYNHFFKARFAQYLEARRPDLVHFFHFSRLSASPIDACAEQGVASVFTPTDFWFLCPLNQLRLPDNSPCSGPDGHAVNCLRHVTAITQPAPIRTVVRLSPIWLLRAAIWMSQNLWWPMRAFPSHVKALTQRPGRLLGLVAKVDRILAPSRLMEHFLLESGLDPARIRFAPYGVRMASGSLPQMQRKDAPLQLGFVGSMAEHKGPHVLIQAVHALPRDMQVALRMYGDLDVSTEFGLEAKKLAAEDNRIELCGTFPNDRISEVMASFDVLVVPSMWYENTPLVVYSAQAAGIPVVASNVPGLSEVIQDGVNGLLFEMGNSPALAAVITRLVVEAGLVETLARQAISPRSVEDHVDQLEAVYEELLFKRGRSP